MSRATSDATAAAFIAHRLLGTRPFPYFLLHRFFGSKRELAFDDTTELVIEGYPRSANSFSVVAFEQAQTRPVKIAHHLHVPAQVIRGVRRGVPTIVLIREPVAAVTSLVVREPALGVGVALWDYERFYRSVFPYREKFMVARFEEVTSDFGRVIERLNEQFGTNFEVFAHDEQNVERAFARLDTFESGSKKGQIDEARVARPSDARQASSEAVRERLCSRAYAKRLRSARALYESLSQQSRPG